MEKNNNSSINNVNNTKSAGQMIPVEINKRPSLGRLIKNKITLAAVSWTNQGFEKLSDADTKIVASIINTALITYNEKTGHPLSKEDIAKIQKRFNEFDVYTFEGDSERYKRRYAKQEKKLGRKLTAVDTKGFLFSPTSILLLKKAEWEKFKNGENIVYFTKVVAHEGFHFLTNTKHNNMSKMGEKLPSEGADESFITKTFNDGEYSSVISYPPSTGLIHYNFNTKSNYGPLVSILNMLGEMVGIKPEVSAFKSDGEFVNAVKKIYGRSFYRRILKVTDKLAGGEEFSKLENAPRYIKTVQNYVLKAITDDIIYNSKNPEDAVRRLKNLQEAEKWSMRILIAEKNIKNGKFERFETDRSFTNYYRFTYTRVIEELRERGFTDVEQKLAQCKYKPVRFKLLVKEKPEKNAISQARFQNKIKDTIVFFKNYYGEQNPSRYLTKEQIQTYKRLRDRHKKLVGNHQTLFAGKKEFKAGPPGAKIANRDTQEIQRPVKPQPPQKPQQPKNPPPQKPQQPKNPPHAKITPIPKKPNGRGDDDGPQFGGF